MGNTQLWFTLISLLLELHLQKDFISLNGVVYYILNSGVCLHMRWEKPYIAQSDSSHYLDIDRRKFILLGWNIESNKTLFSLTVDFRWETALPAYCTCNFQTAKIIFNSCVLCVVCSDMTPHTNQFPSSPDSALIKYHRILHDRSYVTGANKHGRL